MAYNFPNSPSNGDTVTISNVTYTYNSTAGAWKTTAAGGASGALVQESAPSNPGSGNLWFDPNSLETFVYYNDGDSNQWVQTNPGGGSSGITVYSSIDDLPLSGASTGDQAYVSGNNRLYIWNGTGWYNIALINTTPSISGVSSSYALATDGSATTVTITATDPEGIPITYSVASDTSGNVATVTQGTGANTNVFTITPSTNTANAGTFSLTFRASDGVNIATAVSEFTLLFSIENSNYTTALITSVGANNADNNDFVDSSNNSHTITAAGNVTQSTFSPYRHAGYSTYFDGSGDYIDFPQTTAIGTNDFTIEAWVYPESFGTNEAIFCTLPSGSSTSLQLNVDASGALAFWYKGVQAGDTVTISSALTQNTWQHIAVVGDNAASEIKIYVDGTQVGSTLSYSYNYSASSNYRVGRNRGGTAYFNGYLRDVRLVHSKVYTTNFTPTSEPLTAITNTKLLTCHLPYITDGSSDGNAATVGGNTKTEPFAPYEYNGYSTADNGGSMYFDGTGDYLTTSASSDFYLDGQFTWECWVHCGSSYFRQRQRLLTPAVSTSSGSAYISIGNDLGINGGAQSGVFCCTYSVNVNPFLYANVNGTNTGTAVTVPLNQWCHLAITRDSNNDVKMWQDGVLVASGSYSGAFDFNRSVGARVGGSGWSTEDFGGHMTDVRIVKGTAVYTSAFTPPTAPLTAITNTSLLLNGTDAGIIDKSQSVKTITLNGDVKSSTTQSKYLSSSMYFDGTGDYITLSDSDAREFGGEDFTIELWVKTTIATQYATLLSRTPTAFGSGMWTIFMNTTASGGQVAVYLGDYSTASSLITTSGASIRDDSWHHVAVVRNGSSFVCYIDGTSRGTGSWAGSITNIAGDIRIGADQNYGRNWEGYMSDVRITKGLARYTSNFTPPTAALQG